MKIAVIGLGFMGATHVKAIRNVPGLELTAVVSGDEWKLGGDLTAVSGNLGSAGERMDFRSVARYRTLEDCLNDVHVEAVDLCLPSDLHAQAAMDALRAGKHVLVEKPMALDADSAECMIAEAEQSGRTLMCAHVVRFTAAYRAAAEELRTLGVVRSAIFSRRSGAPSWSPWLRDPSRSGGAAVDLLIHDLDYAISLFGKPESVSARGFTDERSGIDCMRAELRYEQVGQVTIEGGWFSPGSYPFRMEFTMMAEHGTLDYSSAASSLSLLREGEEPKAIATTDDDPFAAEIAYFAECASAGTQPALCPPRESVMAVRVAHCMVESRKREGKRVLCSISG